MIVMYKELKRIWSATAKSQTWHLSNTGWK